MPAPTPAAVATQMAAEASTTSHHGRPGLPAHRKAAWADRAAAAAGPGEVATWAADFIAHPDPTVRQVGLLLLARPAVDAREAERLAGPLAGDPDWEVREWVVEPLVAHALGPASDWLLRWAEGGGPERRAAVVAARQLVRQGGMDCAAALKVASLAVDDPDRYVAASVGTFLLADGIYVRCPDAFWDWVETLADRPAPLGTPRWRHLAAVARRHPAARERLRPLLATQDPHYGRGPTHR